MPASTAENGADYILTEEGMFLMAAPPAVYKLRILTVDQTFLMCVHRAGDGERSRSVLGPHVQGGKCGPQATPSQCVH